MFSEAVRSCVIVMYQGMRESEVEPLPECLLLICWEVVEVVVEVRYQVLVLLHHLRYTCISARFPDSLL